MSRGQLTIMCDVVTPEDGAEEVALRIIAAGWETREDALGLAEHLRLAIQEYFNNLPGNLISVTEGEGSPPWDKGTKQ